jgi:hypothetical protein
MGSCAESQRKPVTADCKWTFRTIDYIQVVAPHTSTYRNWTALDGGHHEKLEALVLAIAMHDISEFSLGRGHAVPVAITPSVMRSDFTRKSRQCVS